MATERKTGLQVARETKQELDVLRREVDSLAADLDRGNLRLIRERLATFDTQMPELQRKASAADQLLVVNAVLGEKVARLEKRADVADKLLERVAVLESQQADAKRAKEESDKRGANFIYAVLGIALGVVANLIVGAFKKS